MAQTRSFYSYNNQCSLASPPYLHRRAPSLHTLSTVHQLIIPSTVVCLRHCTSYHTVTPRSRHLRQVFTVFIRLQFSPQSNPESRMSIPIKIDLPNLLSVKLPHDYSSYHWSPRLDNHVNTPAKPPQPHGSPCIASTGLTFIIVTRTQYHILKPSVAHSIHQLQACVLTALYTPTSSHNVWPTTVYTSIT